MDIGRLARVGKMPAGKQWELLLKSRLGPALQSLQPQQFRPCPINKGWHGHGPSQDQGDMKVTSKTIQDKKMGGGGGEREQEETLNS